MADTLEAIAEEESGDDNDNSSDEDDLGDSDLEELLLDEEDEEEISDMQQKFEEGEEDDFSSQSSQELLLSQYDEMMDEELVVRVSKPKYVECEEDDEFVNMFDKMLNDSIVESRRVGVPPVAGGGDLVAPMHAKQKKNFGTTKKGPLELFF